MASNNIIESLENLKDKSFGVVLGIILLISAGTQTIFLFDNSLFLSLDVAKLLLLVMAFGISIVIIPFLMLFLVFIYFIESEKKHYIVDIPDKYTMLFILISPVAYFVSTISLIVSYIFGLDFITYILIILVIYSPIIALPILVLISNFTKGRKNK